ncbi:uncharacterized protein LTR77_006640 [Saxophila tyrrhenica]|uniref:Malic acid transport protein n=1 Tax=Saxophila tyrrhenica TaxID=1690608 RepID=A0AAV9P7E4_9PEZI|nr:hypothetical protein LTR77_006640 [Saxophila tyrrhenica]
METITTPTALQKEEAVLEDKACEAVEKITMRLRIKHFTWAQFTMPLSTGGIGLLLASQPHRFAGLETIGKIFFIFDLVILAVALATICARFILHPGTFTQSLVHPTEALFIPTVLITLANLIGSAQVYGGPHCGHWFLVAMQVLFWLYVAAAFSGAVVQYLSLFTGHPNRLTVQSMTPAWILPIFPIMIGGTLANLIAPEQNPTQRMAIIVAGVSFQGLGWMVAFLMYAAYIQRLMAYGLPAPNLRPGMMISVGPPSFTGLALIGLSQALPPTQSFFATRPFAVQDLQAMALFAGIFLWVLAFWFFCITTISVMMGIREMSFHLIWWGLVFPNVGFTIATIKIGQQLESEGILWVASIMSILLVAMWIFVLGCHIRALVRKDIMMPGKDEDQACYKTPDEKRGII